MVSLLPLPAGFGNGQVSTSRHGQRPVLSLGSDGINTDTSSNPLCKADDGDLAFISKSIAQMKMDELLAPLNSVVFKI